MRGEECHIKVLKQALERTADKRGSRKVLINYNEILKQIRESITLRDFWKKFQRDYDYSKDISFNDVCDTVQHIMDIIPK